MKNKKIEKTYCKECGGHLDKHTRICQNCGKRYFKFRVIHLLNILSCLLIVFLSVTCIGIYDMYQDALQDKKYYSDENTELSNKNEELSSQNDSLCSRISELESEKSELEERNKLQAERMSNMAIEAENKLKRQSQYNSIHNNTTIVATDDTTCLFPSCENDANRNSFYCISHECTEIGCHEKRANDLCMYCEAHKCHVPDCNSGVSRNSNYCYHHRR